MSPSVKRLEGKKGEKKMAANAFQRKILGWEDFELEVHVGGRTKQSRSWGHSIECNPVRKYHAIYTGPYFPTERQETLIKKKKTRVMLITSREKHL